MTLRARLALFVGLSVGAAVALVAVFAYGFARDEATAEVDRFLRERGPVVGLLSGLDVDDYRLGPARGQGQGPGQGSGPGRDPVASVVQEDAVAQLVDRGGGILAIGDSGVVLPVSPADLRLASGTGPDILRDVEIDEVHYRMLTRHIGPGLAIQVARDMSGTDEILAGLRIRLFVLGLAGVALAAAVGWLVSRRSLRPVGALTAAAAHVAATRELDSKIEVTRSDEIGQLASSFNEMLGALEEARDSQRRLVADASHELRTPLTSLRTNIELLTRGAFEDAEREEVLDDVGSELLELSHLVEELVDLATIGRHEEPTVEVDLAEIVHQAAERARRRSAITVTVHADATLIEGHPSGLLRAVSNLLENAVKWGADDPRIEVALTDATVTVRDHGPGIPTDDLGRVFERFYRSPEARPMPGSGLGLAIVAAVAEEHGGRAFATNAPDGGAIVGFTVATSTG